MVSFWLVMAIWMQLCLLAFSQNNSDPDQGFINIDCGFEGKSSKDSNAGLIYSSDEQYINTGVNCNVSSSSSTYRYATLNTLRSFRDNIKNCYTFNLVANQSKYLVRAMFYHGNYENFGNSSLNFDLYFGVNYWDTVEITKPDELYVREIIAIAPASYIQICLVNTGRGTPFISALELRPLNSTLYELAHSKQSLNLIRRKNVGEITGKVYRYPDDTHDRLWFPYNDSSWDNLGSPNNTIDGISFDIPPVVLQSAAAARTNTSSIDITWPASYNKSTTFFFVLHFAEIFSATRLGLREFHIYSNGVRLSNDPVVLDTTDKHIYRSYTPTGYTNYSISLRSTENSKSPPILNAYEVYSIVPVISLPTDNQDVAATNSIKSKYSIKDWSGDPCVPISLRWTGLNCTITSNISRITALNLSSSRLDGEIIAAFGQLTKLEKLDLSRNNLSGNIPSSMDQLTVLTFLDVSGNSYLNVTLPSGLQKRQQDRQLTVITKQPGKKTHSQVVIYVIAVVITSLIVGAGAFFFLYQKKHKDSRNGRKETLYFDKKHFSFEELKVITKKFSNQLGVGGFGKVFKGNLQGMEVAVKVRSESSSQGIEQFLNEVKNLSRVHHKNLVSLVGYCSDGNQVALVYEYMQGGNLQDWLSNASPLPWNQRLRIAYESAQGLEYLHKMCYPAMIHRDVKTSNILLTSKNEAKISDFGLVRTFSDTHVTTQVVGTPGYLDPSYASSLQLTPKSDVYSFGVVLLEIITGKPPILQGSEGSQHLTQFVQQRLSKGNIESILDRYTGDEYNINSIWKVADLALRCTAPQPAKRPDMTTVVTELKESLDLETSNTESSVASTSADIRRSTDGVDHDSDIETVELTRGVLTSNSGPYSR